GTNVIISFYIALNTGMRESEIFGLQWSDVDFEAKKIKIHIEFALRQILTQYHTITEIAFAVSFFL
ncbi:MAG: tyrosine-type recombinase/integrase, partial [Clostridia bacterium]|nr:tyrosine-type recombinase/integrase [Clostridia bacterium]